MAQFQIYNYQFGRIEKHDKQMDLFGEQNVWMSPQESFPMRQDLFQKIMDEDYEGAEDKKIKFTHQGEALDDGGNVGINVGINVGTNVGENERKILSIIAHTPHATAREMAEALGITLRGCERILALLKQKGLIARVGANKGGYWKIVLD